MIKVIDDVISKGFQSLVERTLTAHQEFPWYYNTNITSHDIDDPNTGFSHLIHEYDRDTRSGYFNITLPILYEAIEKAWDSSTQMEELYRIRAGLFLRNQTNVEHHVPHVDYDFEHFSMLYYVSDADGPTYFFDEDGKTITTTVEPLKGRAVVFSGDVLHASSSPKNHKHRIVLNYNFLV